MLLCVTDADHTGAPIYVKRVYDVIVSRGISCHIVTSRHGSLLKELEVKLDERKILSFYDVFALVRAVYILYKVKPAVLWVNSFKMSVIMRLANVFYFSRVKVVYTVHGLSIIPGKVIRNGLIISVEKLLTALTDRYIFLTDFDRANFQNLVNRNIHSCIVANTSGTSISDSSSKKSMVNDGAVFLMVARNDDQKDYPTLLNAFKIHLGKYKKSTLICVGRGTDSVDFQEKVEIIGIPKESIELIGESNKVSEYYSRADFFILSTNYEGMPLVLLEAMSAGIPIICSDVSGIGEFIDKSFGNLFERGNSSQLAKTMGEFCSLDNRSYRAMAEQAKRNYQLNYSNEAFEGKIVHFLDGLL